MKSWDSSLPVGIVFPSFLPFTIEDEDFGRWIIFWWRWLIDSNSKLVCVFFHHHHWAMVIQPKSQDFALLSKTFQITLWNFKVPCTVSCLLFYSLFQVLYRDEFIWVINSAQGCKNARVQSNKSTIPFSIRIQPANWTTAFYFSFDLYILYNYGPNILCYLMFCFGCLISCLLSFWCRFKCNDGELCFHCVSIIISFSQMVIKSCF